MKPKTPIFLFLLLMASSLTAQNKKNSFFDLLPKDKLLKIELTLDIDSLLANRRTNDYFPATLTFEDKNGQDQSWELKVRSRGKFRRSRCDFPPLRLEFDKDDLRDRNMRTFDSYKLITHCLQSPEGKVNVMRECLVYRLYRVVNPEYSIRSQLVRIKYKDTGNRRRIVQYGAILEDENEVADRIDREECEACYSLPTETFNRQVARRHALFQYMVGNHDWSVPTVRNIMVMQSEDSTDSVIIPYDFDFAGIVAASYVRNAFSIPLDACGGRVYMGFENKQEELRESIEYFQSIRKELEETIWDFRWLDSTSRSDMQRYLDQFYDCINSGQVVFIDKSQF